MLYQLTRTKSSLTLDASISGVEFPPSESASGFSGLEAIVGWKDVGKFPVAPFSKLPDAEYGFSKPGSSSGYRSILRRERKRTICPAAVSRKRSLMMKLREKLR